SSARSRGRLRSSPAAGCTNSSMTAGICSASPATEPERCRERCDAVSRFGSATKKQGTDMARSFLIRGMLCGIAAGLLVFLFAKIFGEPNVDGAIGFEEHLAHLAGAAHEHEEEIVSRDVQ